MAPHASVGRQVPNSRVAAAILGVVAVLAGMGTNTVFDDTLLSIAASGLAVLACLSFLQAIGVSFDR